MTKFFSEVFKELVPDGKANLVMRQLDDAVSKQHVQCARNERHSADLLSGHPALSDALPVVMVAISDKWSCTYVIYLAYYRSRASTTVCLVDGVIINIFPTCRMLIEVVTVT